MCLNNRWDVDLSVDCCSEQVEIIFLALHNTISEIGAKAYVKQGRSVTNHVIEIVSFNLYLVHAIIVFLYCETLF